MSEVLSLAVILITVWLLNGVYVLGQSLIPADADINCYGDDSTCMGSFTTHTSDQSFVNPCCYQADNPTQPQSITALNSGYYSVEGGVCQSCMDSNVQVTYGTATCSDSSTCQPASNIFDPFFQTFLNPFFDRINPCCGVSANTMYYSLDGGSCLPCSFPFAMPPTSGADPHFVCPLKNGQLLCFSVQGEPDFIFNLFSDANIQVNAKFSLPQKDESLSLMNSSTFIQDVGLSFRAANNRSIITKIKLSALDHTITVSDNDINVGSKPITINIVKGSVQMKISSKSTITESLDETAPISITSDVGFAVKVKFIKSHLNMAIKDTTGLSKKAHGIQGQFMGPDVNIDTRNGLIRIGNMAPFSVRLGEIWPYLHEPGECWYAINAGNQGEGILEGFYTDYIVEDLFDSKFKYSQF